MSALQERMSAEERRLLTLRREQLTGGADFSMLTQMKRPAYRMGQLGRWRLDVIDPGTAVYGYWSGPQYVPGNVALIEKPVVGCRERTWMSLTPMELESQAIPCVYGHGHCVVMGLGLGVVPYNMALNPAVERVTVIEQDTTIIRLMWNRLLDRSEECWRKVHVQEGDALNWRPTTSPVDVLYADIWPQLAEPRSLPDTQRMQARIGADRVYFWGQELMFYYYCRGRLPGSAPLPNMVPTANDFREFCSWSRLPLMGLEVPDYPRLALRALIQQLLQYGRR